MDSQLAMLNAADNFLKQSQKPTKVIVIEGARGTGKSYVAQQIFTQLVANEKFKINFKRHRFLNEVYAEILFQIDPQGLLSEEEIMKNPEPLEPQQSPQLLNTTSEGSNFLVYPMEDGTRLPVLKNIIFNKLADKDCAFLFDEVKGRMNDVINAGLTCTYIIVCDDSMKLQLEPQVAVDILVLQTQELTPKEIMRLFNQSSQTQQVTLKDVTHAISVVGHNVDNVAYYLHTGVALSHADDIKLTAEQTRILKKFCLIPGKFPFKFIQFMAGEMPGKQLKVVNDLLRKMDGQYAIPIDIRVKLTHELTPEEHRELSQRVIDFCLEELKHMNALHMW